MRIIEERMRKLVSSSVFLLALAGSAEAEPKEFTCDVKGSSIHCTAAEDNLPTLKTGFLVDLDPEGRDGFFYVGLEVANWRVSEKEFSLDFGIASSRVMVGLSWGAFYNGKVGPFLWAGYNIADNSPAYGVGFTVLKL